MDENKFPLVSIVTPSLNQGRFIRETIESILLQDYPYIEHIIIDGGSTDGTLDILKMYGDRIFWISEKDKGQSDAINKGWKRARGKIYGWLNSDDTYLPGAITKAVKFLCDNKDVMMVYGEGWHIDEYGKIIQRYPTEPFKLARLAETCFICQPTVFFRKELIEKIGYLDENLNYCMDYDFWIRAGRIYSIGYINDYLANSRLYPETKTLGQKAKVHKEIVHTQCRYFRHVASDSLRAYCHVLLEERIGRNNFFAKLIYLMVYTLTYFVYYMKYNKRISIEEVARYCHLLKEHLLNLFKQD